MKLDAIRALLEPHVAARMRLLEPTADLGNGTLLADAATTIACHVIGKRGARVAREPVATTLGVGDDEMRRIIDSVRDLMLSRDVRDAVTLPCGVRLEPGSHTGVGIGRSHYRPIRGRPGLHETADMADLYLPERPGSRLLREAISFHMMRLPAMDVQKPSADQIRVVNEYRYRDTILVPMRGGPGVTYMDTDTIDPVETMLDIEIDLEARTIAAKGLEHWKDRERIDEGYARVMAEMGPLIEAEQAKGMPVSLVGVRINRQTHNGLLPGAVPIIELLGNDLKPTTWSPWYDPRKTTLGKLFATQMVVQRRRKRVLDGAAADGARGRIDKVTLAAIRHWAKDPAEVLRRMASDRRATVRTDQDNAPIRLVWRNGEVKASFPFTKAVVWQQGTIILKSAQVPQTVLDTLPGKPVRNLVEHPFLEPDDTIRSIRVNRHGGQWIHVHVDTSWTTFDAETGEVGMTAAAA